jgi:hypothetical protein
MLYGCRRFMKSTVENAKMMKKYAESSWNGPSATGTGETLMTGKTAP